MSFAWLTNQGGLIPVYRTMRCCQQYLMHFGFLWHDALYIYEAFQRAFHFLLNINKDTAAEGRNLAMLDTLIT